MLIAYILAQVCIFIGILIFTSFTLIRYKAQGIYLTQGTKKWTTQHLLDKKVPIETH